jgi:hypothetical protein
VDLNTAKNPSSLIMNKSIHICGSIILVFVLLGVYNPKVDKGFEFVLLGDLPYSDAKVKETKTMIRDINSRKNLEWVIHLGDTKGGSQPCSDKLLTNRFELFQRFDIPFILTPGDNDWYDCSQESAGSWDPEERLKFLRKLYYSDVSNPQFTTRSQAKESEFTEFVENRLWVKKKVVFATIHLIRMTKPEADPTVSERRMAAASNWIETAFAEAKKIGSPGIFLSTQVDPWRVWGPPGTVAALCPACIEPVSGIELLYKVLVKEVAAYDGQVVLAVGDTHIFRVDKPLYDAKGSLIENFTRVEVFGNPIVRWTRVKVDPSEHQVFTFYQEKGASSD